MDRKRDRVTSGLQRRQTGYVISLLQFFCHVISSVMAAPVAEDEGVRAVHGDAAVEAAAVSARSACCCASTP